ncbi:Uncharacterised protein [Chlamydia abortus]|nr:Uncharacterised protein [Chlamydia abortus]
MFLIFHDFQFSCHIPCPTEDISKFSTFSVFLAIFHVLKCVFLIFRDFQFSRHIPGPSVCISHFLRFLVISSFFKSSSGCFSFSMIFSFLAIFHLVDISKFSTFFSFPRHISRPKVCISHFLSFSVHFTFFTSFSDFVIFQVVKWMFLIFHDFQFSCHIPRPTLDISKFSTFFSFPRHISRPKVCISHFLLAIFQVLQCAFHIFHVS